MGCPAACCTATRLGDGGLAGRGVTRFARRWGPLQGLWFWQVNVQWVLLLLGCWRWCYPLFQERQVSHAATRNTTTRCQWMPPCLCADGYGSCPPIRHGYRVVLCMLRQTPTAAGSRTKTASEHCTHHHVWYEWTLPACACLGCAQCETRPAI